jgi:hypothetical protein
LVARTEALVAGEGSASDGGDGSGGPDAAAAAAEFGDLPPAASFGGTEGPGCLCLDWSGATPITDFGVEVCTAAVGPAGEGDDAAAAPAAPPAVMMMLSSDTPLSFAAIMLL